MILPLLLASTLAAATPAPEPVAEPAAAPFAAAVEKPGLDEPITLNLKDADVGDVLEKLAELIGVTPILDPDVRGRRVDIELRGVPLGKAIELLGSAAKVEISVSGKFLRARSKGAATAVPPPPARPRAAEAPDVLLFRLDGSTERPVAVRLPVQVGRVRLPGCGEPVVIGRLGPYGGRASWIAFASKISQGGRPMGRILGGSAIRGSRSPRPGLPGCDPRLIVEDGEASAGLTPIDTELLEKREPLIAEFRLFEITEETEEILVEPRIAFRSDSGFSVRSGFTASVPGEREQEIVIHGASLGTTADGTLLAVHVGITRNRSASEGGGALEAQRAESFWLRDGSRTRWTVDSSWDGGRAALVLEVTLTRPAPR